MSLSKEQYQEIVRVLQENVDKLSQHDPITIQAVYPDRYEKMWVRLETLIKQMLNSSANNGTYNRFKQVSIETLGYLQDEMERFKKEEGIRNEQI